MTPIVSPIFIYLLSIIATFKGVVAVVAIFGSILALFAVIGHWCVKNFPDEFDQDWLLIWKSVKRVTLIPALICIFLSTFVPSRNTIIAMYVTTFITKDNVTEAIKAGGEFKDVIKEDIIEIIDALKGQVEKAKAETNEN